MHPGCLPPYHGYIGEYLLKGFLDMPYEWHLQRNSADLIQGIGWRVYLGNLITAALKLLSDVLIVLILLTTLLIASPAISLLVFLTLGGTSLLIMRRYGIPWNVWQLRIVNTTHP